MNEHVQRCWWCGTDPEYQRYHDEEWGRPVHDDRRLFEKLCLEGFQAGLSWLTILRKRDNFRRALHDFDWSIISQFTNQDIERLLQDKGIIRHRGKIEAVINNAQLMPALINEHGSFSNFIWSFKPSPEERPAFKTRETLSQITQTYTSVRLAKTLKSRGFKFFGPTTAYAFMQAMGLVNDHVDTCHIHDEIAALNIGSAPTK